ncbi:MAG: glycosyltransferase [Parcubacteria group bacterium]
MKILEINKFNYIQGGAETHFLDVVKLLRSQGNEAAVFAMDSPKNLPSPWKKYFVSYVGYSRTDTLWSKIKGAVSRFYSFEAKRKIGRLLDDFQPEIAHIHNIYHQLSPSILPEIKRRGIPIVMTVHDNKLVYPHYLPNRDREMIGKFSFFKFVFRKEFKNSFLKSLLTAIEFEICQTFNLYDKYIDLYISPSNFTKRKLIAGGIRAEKIVVVPHFSSREIGQEIGVAKNSEKYVLYAGRISREKGVDELLKIFQELPEINLYLAGKIEDGLEIPRLRNIKHLGFLSPSELEKYIQNSMFVVSPSKLLETFGLTALEALSLGKPFIGFSGGAYGEIIENNKTGFLCSGAQEMKEYIQKLASDNELRAQFSKNALERAKDFGMDEYYGKIMEIFQKLKNNSGA